MSIFYFYNCSFTLVLLLLKNEHVMVEKLLKFFVCIVNTELFKRVKVENFKTGNIKNTDKDRARLVISKGAIYDSDQPIK